MKSFYGPLLAIIAIILLVVSINAWVSQPFAFRENAARVSPFTAVRWRGDVVEVRYEDLWSELRSIDDIPVEKLMDYLATSKDKSPRTHFAENLVDVMTGYGHKPGATVRLVLRTLDPQAPRLVTVPAAEMTPDNLTAVTRFSRDLYSDSDEDRNLEPLAVLDARHGRLVEQLNRYTINYRTAAEDVKTFEEQVAAKGGQSLGADGNPKEMEMKRRVTDQLDLQTLVMEVDNELAMCVETKKRGQATPTVARAVEASADMARAREAVAAARAKAAGAEANADALAAAENHLDEVQESTTKKLMQDYEDDLRSHHQHLHSRLDELNATVAQLKVELAEIRNLNRALARREEDAEEYRKCIQRCDTQIREVEMASEALHSPAFQSE